MAKNRYKWLLYGRLHRDLHQDVYIQLPLGFQYKNGNQLCKLQHCLYGLKQVMRQWYAKLSQFLISHRYPYFSSNHSLFLKHSSHSTSGLLVYVDDIIHTENDYGEIPRINSSWS